MLQIEPQTTSRKARWIVVVAPKALNPLWIACVLKPVVLVVISPSSWRGLALQVTGAKYFRVVSNVTGEDICEGTHCRGAVVGNAASQPRFGRKIFE